MCYSIRLPPLSEKQKEAVFVGFRCLIGAGNNCHRNMWVKIATFLDKPKLPEGPVITSTFKNLIRHSISVL